MTVKEAVNTAIERCLDGSRRWDDSDPPELGSFLCGVIRSIVSTERKKATRDKVALDCEAVESAPQPEEAEEDGVAEDGRVTVCSAVEACATGDEVLESYYLAVLDGHITPAAIAGHLGWSPSEASAARNKLQRRLISRFPQEFANRLAKRRQR